jgi:glycosyltransferase involved in cell wall biosynthesis
MKIYFNRRPVAGPWGGGSKILSSIVEECSSRSHQIFFEEQLFSAQDLDVILCVDPRPNHVLGFQHLLSYKAKNPNCKLVQRIGDLGTHGKPELFELIKKTTAFVDFLIFPSEWAKSYLNSNKVSYVIPNAPLKNFNRKKTNFNLSPISIVSHHWSNNSMKGFEIYQELDSYCQKNYEQFKFTFIGRKPDSVNLKNYINPLDINGLVQELPKHDVYITASKFEAGANHVLEAMACGLPILYHVDGGSINEYCKNFGFAYNNIEELIEILNTKKSDIQALSNFVKLTRTADEMAREYADMFESIV